MDIEDFTLLNISKNKLNPAHPAFLNSQGKEKDTEREWFFSSSASSPVSQKNNDFFVTKKSDNSDSTTPFAGVWNQGKWCFWFLFEKNSSELQVLEVQFFPKKT